MTISSQRRPTASVRPARRWEPMRDLEELQQLLESAWSDRPAEGEPRPWMPAVDIEEAGDALVIEAELPGVRREDVDVEVRDNELTISGEIKEREKTGIIRRRTRRVGRFEYRVVLPSQVDPERMEAKLSDGVLTIRIPRPEEERSHHIEVQPG